MKLTKEVVKLAVITLISVIVMGLALSVLNLVNLGNDPFTYMNIKIAEKFDISLGNWQVVLNIIMFIPVIIWGRKQIGIGTIFNMVLVGYSVDFFSWIWNISGFDTIFDSMVVRILIMIPAIIVFVFSAAVYMSTDLGTAPYDAIPFMIAKRFAKIPFKYVRFCWDLVTVIIGFVVSGQLGIVTVAMMLFMGQAVSFVKNKIIKS